MPDTIVTYKISAPVYADNEHGHSDEIFEHTFTHKGVELNTLQEAEDYSEWGGKGNEAIQEAQYYSEFGVLNTWKVLKVEVIGKPIKLASFYLKKKAKSKLSYEEVTAVTETPKKRTYKRRKTKPFYHGENNGWIDLEGNWHPITGLGEHNEFAREVLEKEIGDFFAVTKYIEKQVGFSGYAYQVLQKRGWIRVIKWSETIEESAHSDKEPNEAQLKTLSERCAKNGWDYNKLIHGLKY
jgi:hypothetical protein